MVCLLGQLAAVTDDNSLGGSARAGAHTLNLVNNIHALDDLAKDHVATVQPGGLDSGDEELRSVGVRASVGHGQHAWASVLQLEVLVRKPGAVDGLATSAVTASEVSTLDHELRNDPVELRTLEVQGLAGLPHTLLTSAQGTEILYSLGDSLSEQTDHDATCWLATNLDIEEHLVGDLWVGSGSQTCQQQASCHQKQLTSHITKCSLSWPPEQ
mmetsp:Transcript_12582/g.27172  ORF Transcript_12582/g.27172 Transcript_12582/m.27172 type:complete len:213 (-) Transcript_12582:10-648(-)